MNRTHRLWHRLVPAIGIIAVVGTIAFLTEVRFGTAASPPLWTERPVVATPARSDPGPWVELARQLKPAVVNISTSRTEKADPELSERFRGNDPFDQFFRQFFGNLPPHTVKSLGSGFIINPAGYVVTNAHVVDGATEIRVKLSDGRELRGTVVGRDPRTDLALLKIDATGLPVIPLADSAEVQVGESVMAIGNPFGLEQTVTTGIVSATGRVIGAGPYDQFIQTDASINPGNSGGPLINARGQAIGINTAIVSTNGGSNGIGFAIPIALAKPVVTQLAATGHVVRGWLGVAIQPVTPDLAKSLHAPDTRGALVASVMPDSPAMKAGVKAGDIIVDYAGREVARSDALPQVVAETAVGREVPLTVLRDGQRVALTATIQRLAEPRAEAANATPATGSLGLAVESLTPQLAHELGVPDTHGALVRGIEDASPAASAGLRAGDVIVEVDHHRVASAEDLAHLVKQHAPGSPVLLLVHRSGHSLFVAVG
jgi:serine protease Do